MNCATPAPEVDDPALERVRLQALRESDRRNEGAIKQLERQVGKQSKTLARIAELSPEAANVELPEKISGYAACQRSAAPKDRTAYCGTGPWISPGSTWGYAHAASRSNVLPGTDQPRSDDHDRGHVAQKRYVSEPTWQRSSERL